MRVRERLRQESRSSVPGKAHDAALRAEVFACILHFLILFVFSPSIPGTPRLVFLCTIPGTRYRKGLYYLHSLYSLVSSCVLCGVVLYTSRTSAVD